MSKRICIGMGEMVVTADQETELTCLGLGSCIAICVYDARRRIGAIVHVVLPIAPDHGTFLQGKYADTAVKALLAELKYSGVLLGDLKVALCGGAAIFGPMSGVMDIGQRNLTAVRAELLHAGIKVVAEDVGGRESRTVMLDVATGVVRLRMVKTGEFIMVKLGACV